MPLLDVAAMARVGSPLLALAVVASLVGCSSRPSRPATVTIPPAGAARESACEGTYVLTAATKRLLRDLKEPLKIEAYVTKGTPKLDAFARGLRALLAQYEAAGGGKVEIVLREGAGLEHGKEAKEAGLLETAFCDTSECEGVPGAVTGFSGLVFTYGRERDAIRVLSPDDDRGIELWITTKLRELRDKTEDVRHKIGVLVGHDEAALSDPVLLPAGMGRQTLLGLLKQYFPFYWFIDVDLDGGFLELPSLDGLLVLQPGKDISEKELRRIDAFVMKGKSLVVAASAVNLAAGDVKSAATLSTHGLEKLLAGYGVEMRNDVVLDFGSPFRIEVMTQSGVQAIRFPTVLDVKGDAKAPPEGKRLDTTSPVFFRIPESAFPFASSLRLMPEKQPGAKLRVLARSTAKSATRTGTEQDLGFLQRWEVPKGGLQQLDVAASVEGELRSAFGGAAKGPGRVLVLSSSQFFANPLARASNVPGAADALTSTDGDDTLASLGGAYARQAVTTTILVAKNTMDWMIADADLLPAAAKTLPGPGKSCGAATK